MSSLLEKTSPRSKKSPNTIGSSPSTSKKGSRKGLLAAPPVDWDGTKAPNEGEGHKPYPYKVLAPVQEAGSRPGGGAMAGKSETKKALKTQATPSDEDTATHFVIDSTGIHFTFCSSHLSLTSAKLLRVELKGGRVEEFGAEDLEKIETRDEEVQGERRGSLAIMHYLLTHTTHTHTTHFRRRPLPRYHLDLLLPPPCHRLPRLPLHPL